MSDHSVVNSSKKRSWGRPKALVRMKIQTKTIRQVGSQSFLVIYCCIYIFRIVSKWENEKEKREQMTAEPVWSHACHIQIKIHIQTEGLWTCARAASYFTYSSDFKGDEAWQGQNFPDFSGSITSICVVFVVHGNTFTVTGHSPLINIEGFFFPSLFVEIIYFFQACIIIVFELVFFHVK